MQNEAVSETIEFIPKWNGNFEKENPFSVKIHPLTRNESNAYAKAVRHKPVKGSREFTNNAVEIEDRRFQKNVHGFVGFFHPITKKEIVTVEDFYSAFGLDDLYIEINDAIQAISTLDPEQVKNFEPQSVGD